MSRDDATMTKVSVSDCICLYVFSDEEANHEDTITVITQENRALLIDTAYPEYAARVKQDLKSNGIKADTVILSHYHPDHVAGLSAFANCKVYASEFYEFNYDNCRIWEPNFIYIRPRHLIKDGDSLTFGHLTLEFFHSPGHCKCSIITKITDKTYHIGDLVMITKDRKDSLPYVSDGGTFDDHINSLQLLKKIDPDFVLVPHGGLIEKNDLDRRLEDRIYYLQKTLSSKGTLPLSQCLKEDVSRYDHTDFHDRNLMRLF
ncbi:MAG: MBL fold metallo-hydrolase [bacterium]|nr:MBL fold metallo-hydrolase [bacterium]